MNMKHYCIYGVLLILTLPLLSVAQSPSQTNSGERKIYTITDVPMPEHVILEAGGMAFMDDGRLAVCTRRGEIWIIDDPYQQRFKTPVYPRFAYGLRQP